MIKKIMKTMVRKINEKPKNLNFERSGIFNIWDEKHLKLVIIKSVLNFNVRLLLSWASFFSKKIKITELHFAYILLLRNIGIFIIHIWFSGRGLVGPRQWQYCNQKRWRSWDLRKLLCREGFLLLPCNN